MHTSNDHKDLEDQLDPKPLNKLFTANSLAHLVSKARQLTTIDEALQKILPTELAPHCRVMNITQDTLVIGVDNPHWATRLRYLSPNLLKDLQSLISHLKHLDKIRCKVRPHSQSL